MLYYETLARLMRALKPGLTKEDAWAAVIVSVRKDPPVRRERLAEYEAMLAQRFDEVWERSGRVRTDN